MLVLKIWHVKLPLHLCRVSPIVYNALLFMHRI
jgi:hypothetical protein